MLRRLLVVLVMLSAAGGVTSPVHAAEPTDPLSPTARVEAAWIVGGGAAVEVRYSVTCPVNPLVGNGLMAMVTTVSQGGTTLGRDYLEFTCTGDPDTVSVTNLASTLGADPGQLTITTKLFNCLFFDGTGVEGCFTPETTTTVTARDRALQVESYEERGSLTVDTISASVTRTGGVRITQVLSCPPQTIVSLETTVTQVKNGVARTGSIFYVAPGNEFADFECDGAEVVTYTVPATVGPGFVKGNAVVQSMIAECFEGCNQGFDTAVVKIRP